MFTSSTFVRLSALNQGFLQTLKLFAVTLIGALPLGLVISFGSMSRWAPLAFLRCPPVSAAEGACLADLLGLIAFGPSAWCAGCWCGSSGARP